MPKYITEPGMKFHNLTTLNPVKAETRANLWDCLCVCGKQVKVAASALWAANVRSCGCRVNNESISSGDQKLNQAIKDIAKLKSDKKALTSTIQTLQRRFDAFYGLLHIYEKRNNQINARNFRRQLVSLELTYPIGDSDD